MKKILTFLIAFTIILTTLGCDKNTNLEGGENDLVTFNDTNLNITTNDLYEKLKAKYGVNFLIDMIDTNILNEEYPDDEEIEDYATIQIDSLKNYYSTEAEFLEYINSYGYEDEEELKDYFKLNYKRNLAVYDYLETLISDEDIQKYYDEKISGDITGSHILIEVNLTDSMTEEEKRTAKEEALEKAEEAIQKLEDGESFENVARDYSDDTENYDNGGSMGTFASLDLDDVTRQEFARLEVGAYSTTPVETEYGYEIFLKVAEKEKPSLESVKTRIIKNISDEKLTADSTLQYEGIAAMREKYGFKIQDEDLEIYYENTMNNLLAGE